MGIELKVGEWYETAGGERVRVALDTYELALCEVDEPMVAVFQSGGSCPYCRTGEFLPARPGSDLDIVKHLPGCTGWDWVEPKPQVWRDAKPEDALRDPPLRCRVKVYAREKWSDRHRVLVGYINPKHAPYPWATLYDGAVPDDTVCRYRYCQVLDE